MKAKVIKAFKDLNDPTGAIYQVGTTYEGADKRIAELENKGFVKAEKVKAEKSKKK